MFHYICICPQKAYIHLDERHARQLPPAVRAAKETGPFTGTPTSSFRISTRGHSWCQERAPEKRLAVAACGTSQAYFDGVLESLQSATNACPLDSHALPPHGYIFRRGSYRIRLIFLDVPQEVLPALDVRVRNLLASSLASPRTRWPLCSAEPRRAWRRGTSASSRISASVPRRTWRRACDAAPRGRSLFSFVNQGFSEIVVGEIVVKSPYESQLAAPRRRSACSWRNSTGWTPRRCSAPARPCTRTWAAGMPCHTS